MVFGKYLMICLVFTRIECIAENECNRQQANCSLLELQGKQKLMAQPTTQHLVSLFPKEYSLYSSKVVRHNA
jgi:hypothetical protein